MSGRPAERPRRAAAALAAASALLLLLCPPSASADCPVSGSDDGGAVGDDDDRTLFVHVVPHTHDDVGWLKTVDQYYYGFNSTIQRAEVKYILDTVVLALKRSKRRTFTYVEMAFFSKWWHEQSEDAKDEVRELVKAGRLSFANGGWCMHDEAATHYVGMIDQTTLGHAFLKKELGVVPKVGWQLDPFGHSATQASLMTSRMGFDALYFGRIDYQDLEKRRDEQRCEGFWSASPSLGDDAKVFWGLTGSYSGGYGPPPGFCFDAGCNDEYLIGLEEDHLKERILDFLNGVGVQAGRTKGRHIMLTVGSDFQYSNAFINFENYDYLIDSVLRYQSSGEIDVPSMFAPRFDKVQIFYSNPEVYTKCKHDDYLRMAAQPASRSATSSSEREAGGGAAPGGDDDDDDVWDTKSDDFFPYSDCDHCFWTGYFTSRQPLKRLERVGSSFLHAARQVESYLEAVALREKGSGSPAAGRADDGAAGRGEETSGGGRGSGSGGGGGGGFPLRRLEEAMGVAQHHDAVSGTSKQHVAYDYAKRIQGGINEAETFVAAALRKALLLDDDDGGSNDALGDLAYCQRLNETVCEVAQDATEASSGKDLYAVVYNALGSRDEFVSVPITARGEYTVERLTAVDNDAAGRAVAGEQQQQKWKEVPSVRVPNANNSMTAGAAPYVLHFDAGTLPPAGAAVYRIRMEKGLSAKEEEAAVVMDGDGVVAEKTTSDVTIDGEIGDVATSMSRRSLRAVSEAGNLDSDLNQVISNDRIKVHFESGLMTRVTSADDDGFDQDVRLEWGYYTSFDSDKSQHSGAYIFRPKTTDEELHVAEPDLSKSWIFKSDLITEVHVGFKQPWIRHITRLKKGQPYVEVEYTVGPIPIDDNVGKEVVARYKTGIQSEGAFYTDSNGREFMKRRRGSRPTWDLKEFEPVAGNYYPVGAAAYIEDGASSLSVLVDRSQGGASLADGSLELMVQRRVLADDARGVGEPLNETDAGMAHYPPFGDAGRLGRGIVVTGVHRVMLGKGRSGASSARSLMDKTWSPPHVFVASSLSSNDVLFRAPGFSAIGCDLPKNVMVITHSVVERMGPVTTFLVRFAHQYAKGEDEELSKAVQIDMQKFYAGFVIYSVEETTLSGNQNLDQWEKSRLVWDKNSAEIIREAVFDDDWVVQLNPMEIKSFLVRLST